MARHASRTDSSIHQLQARVPLDVVDRLRGAVLTVECPAMRSDPEATISATIGRTVKASLRTRDGEVATVRRMIVLGALERLYASARTGEATLSHRQMVGLAGEVYGLLRSRFDDDPGDPAAWEAWKAFVRAARQGRIPTAPSISLEELADEREEAARLFGPDLTAGIDALPASGDRAALEDRCGRLTWWVLSRHGFHVDRATRLRLLEHVADACLDAGWAIKRAAQGDYAPDPKAQRFPPVETRASGITLSAIFERWERETKPSGSTITTWKGIVSSLKASVGHEDAARITDHDVVKWKDSRVAAGRSAKTVNDSDLACIRALYRFAIANKLVTTNPADGVKVSAKAKAGTSKLPYTDDEIARLLQAAERETLAYRRWLPLLLVATGARVGEMAQLSGDRVRTVDGVPCLVIEPAADGGSLKNATSERTVPMHPVLIRRGFLDFVKARGEGPLFYGRAKGNSARHASVGPRNHLSTWIRSLPGFDDDRKSPAHATRHWWKSVASRIGIPDSVADFIQGHAAASVAGRYRHFALDQLAAEIAKMPVPSIAQEDDGTMPVPMPVLSE